MLNYLNGIGRAIRTKSPQNTRVTVRQILKAVPKTPVQAFRMIKAKSVESPSPLAQSRLKKSFIVTRNRAKFVDAGEPITIETASAPSEQEMEQANAISESDDFNAGEQGVNEQEFNVPGQAEDENGQGSDLGVYYPNYNPEIGLFKGYKEKKSAKTGKKTASASKKTSKGEAWKIKAQAKLEKAKNKTGKGSDLLNKGLDTATAFLNKGKGNADETAPEPSFFEKNKTMLLVGGAGLLAVILLPKLLKKK